VPGLRNRRQTSLLRAWAGRPRQPRRLAVPSGLIRQIPDSVLPMST
jgi:hypothetical protein